MKEFLKRLFTRNPGLKLMALAVAVVFFVISRADRERVTVMLVPVKYVYDGNRKVLTSEPVRQVRLSLKGRWSAVNRFKRRKPRTLELDLKKWKSGVMNFVPEMFQVPSGVRVVAVSPASATIRFESRISRTVALMPRRIGTPAGGFQAGSPTVSPRAIEVSGPRSAIESLVRQGLPLEPVDLTGAATTIVRKVALAHLPPGCRAPEGPFRVTYPMIADVAERTLPDVPVRAVWAGAAKPGRVPLAEPRVVAVGLKGARDAVDGLDVKSVFLRLRVRASDLAQGRPALVPVGANHVTGIPKAVEVLFVRPEKVSVRSAAPEPVQPPDHATDRVEPPSVGARARPRRPEPERARPRRGEPARMGPRRIGPARAARARAARQGASRNEAR